MDTQEAGQRPERRPRQVKFGDRTGPRRRAGWALSAVLLMLAILTPIAAGATTTQSQPGISQGARQAATDVTQDAQLIAEEYGVPVETVLERLWHEEVVSALIEGWASLYPDGYAGAYHADGFVAASVVMWVGTVPEAVLAQAAPYGLSLSFDTSSPISASAYDQLTRDAAALLASNGHNEAIVEPSPMTKSLAILIRADDLAAPGLDATEKHLKTLLPEGITSNVMEKDGQLVDSTAAVFHGGTRIHRAWTSRQRCTSAFTVTRGRTSGLLTAGHCDGMTRYKIPFDGRVRVLTEQGMHEGVQGDIGWYSFSGTPSPVFYTGSGRYDKRTLTGMQRESSFSRHQTVCFYGRSSNNSDCGKLDTWNLCILDNGIQYCNLARVTLKRVSVQKGDSGGPWYLGHRAVGITMGRRAGDAKIAYFTPVEAALNRYGLRLVYG